MFLANFGSLFLKCQIGCQSCFCCFSRLFTELLFTLDVNIRLSLTQPLSFASWNYGEKTCEITRSFIRWYCCQLVFCRRVINLSSKTLKLVERLDVYDFVEQTVLSATTSPWINKLKENDQRAPNISLSSQHLFEKCWGNIDSGAASIASSRRVAIQDQYLSRCRRAQAC